MAKDEHPQPPKETRWKKGVSGNPRGRPKKADLLTNLLQREIRKICPADRHRRTWRQLVVVATLQLAIKGNAVALKEVWERMDGKVINSGKLQVDGDGNNNVSIRVVYDDLLQKKDID
jgi:hypothetical protein